MRANKPVIKSNLAKADAHVLTQADYDEIPELPDAFFANAVPHQAGKPVGRGRPKLAAPKAHINIRLSASVLDHFKASGPGWQGRIDAALLDWIARNQ